MTFDHALIQLRARRRVRRAGWAKGMFLKLVGGSIAFQDGVLPLLDSPTLLAEDWEII